LGLRVDERSPRKADDPLKPHDRTLRGQALAELAVLLPLFLLMLAGVGKLTLVMRDRLRAQARARLLAWTEAPPSSEAVRQTRPMSRPDVPLESPLPTLQGQTLAGLLDRAGRKEEGWVVADVSLSSGNRTTARARHAVLLSAGHLTEGQDVVSGHQGSQFLTETRKFLWLGSAPSATPMGLLERLLPLPKPDDLYLVSKNYGPLQSGERPCAQWPGYPAAARHGQMNLGNGVDAESERCFDTAPFRDTHAYEESLYAQMFLARGPHFMGCASPEEEDPTRAACGARP